MQIQRNSRSKMSSSNVLLEGIVPVDCIDTRKEIRSEEMLNGKRVLKKVRTGNEK